MFGLTLEKLIVIGVIAAIVLGPERLPRYAEKLADFIRSFRDFTASTKSRAEHELGVPLDTASWNRQFRRYDPRSIVRDAIAADGTASTVAVADTSPAPPQPEAGQPEAEPSTTATSAGSNRHRWVVVGGSSGHPIRRRVIEPVLDEQAPVPVENFPVDLDTAESSQPTELRQAVDN